MQRGRSFDPISVLEAAYDIDRPDKPWLEEIMRTAIPGLDGGLGLFAGLWRKDEREIRGSCDVATSEGLLRLTQATWSSDEVRQVAHLYSHVPSVLTMCSTAGVLAERQIQNASVELGTPVGDGQVATVGDGAASGLVVGTYTRERLTRAFDRRRWLQLLAHIGAALRLRRALEVEVARTGTAILDPSGRLLHAEGDAREPTGRDALEVAVRAIDRARGRLRKSAPEEALASWNALVAGRWSVIDWIESDGRRFLVAHENGVSQRGPRALTVRERQVAEYAAHGRSNSEIGYALGLSTGTVNRTVRDALRKLGRARRTDLAMIFGAPEMVRAELADETSVVVLGGAPRSESLWQRLSPSEREVVAAALGGASNKVIAAKRGRSERTIANQLAVTYARFRVRGRSELAALLGPTPGA